MLLQVLLLLPYSVLLLLLVLLACRDLDSCSGLSCLLALQVVGECVPGYDETDCGLASNCEVLSERLVFYDALSRTGLGYQPRRGKLDSKLSSSGEVQETYARSTMLKIPCCLAPKASFRDAKPSCIERTRTAVNCLSSLGPLHNCHLQCLTTLTLWLNLLILQACNTKSLLLSLRLLSFSGPTY